MKGTNEEGGTSHFKGGPQTPLKTMVVPSLELISLSPDMNNLEGIL